MPFGRMGARGGFGSLGLLGAAGGPAVLMNPTAGFAGVSVSRAASAFAEWANGTLTSFAPNVARITDLGLWKEPTRTNLLGSPGDLSAAPWTTFINNTGTVSVTANSGLAPDGTNTAALITVNRSTGGSWAVVYQVLPTLTAAGYSGSFYVQAATAADVGKNIYMIFKNGATYGGSIAIVLTASRQRVSLPNAVLNTTAGWQFLIGYPPDTDGPYLQLGSVSFLASCADVELGAYSTTYKVGTRDADVASIGGALATLLARATATINVTTNKLQQATASTFIDANGTALIGKLSTDVVTTSVGGVLSGTTTGTWDLPATTKLAWDASGGKIELNSGAVASDALARTPTGPFTIGSNFSGVIYEIKGWNTKQPLAAAASVPITGLTFGTEFKYNSGYPTKYMNADVWSNTWADDDIVYTVHDDSNLWSSATNKSNLAVSTLSTTDTSMTGTMVNTMDAFGTLGQLGSDGANYKAGGIISVNGVLYIGVSRHTYGTVGSGWIQSSLGGQIIKSTDHGLNWTPLPPATAQPYVSPMFPTAKFSSLFFIQYGKNYVGNTLHNSDLYVYAVGTAAWNNADNMYLGRVLISEIGLLDATKWSFWISGDGMSSSNWGSLAAANPIVSKTKGVSMNGVQYLSASNRYVMIQWYYPSITQGIAAQNTAWSAFDLYESQFPWGPWTLVQSKTFPTEGNYNANIMPKSIAADGGKTGMVITTGNYQLQNNQTGRYTLILLPTTVNN